MCHNSVYHNNRCILITHCCSVCYIKVMSCCARQIRASNEILSCGHLTGDEDGIMTTVSGSASAASSAAAAAPPGTMTQLIGTLHEYKPEVEPFTVYMEQATIF